MGLTAIDAREDPSVSIELKVYNSGVNAGGVDVAVKGSQS